MVRLFNCSMVAAPRHSQSSLQGYTLVHYINPNAYNSMLLGAGGLLEQSRRSQSYQQLHSLQTLQMPHHIPSVMKSAPQLPPLSSPASPIAASATLETPPWCALVVGFDFRDIHTHA
eukprot:221811-Pelagomonas_calceolata.AAC.1